MTVANCNGFNATIKCTKCISGYNLYNNGNDGYCCVDGTFLSGTTCVKLFERPKDCDYFFLNNMTCNTCDTENYLGNGFCCADYKKWDTSSGACVAIPTEHAATCK